MPASIAVAVMLGGFRKACKSSETGQLVWILRKGQSHGVYEHRKGWPTNHGPWTRRPVEEALR